MKRGPVAVNLDKNGEGWIVAEWLGAMAVSVIIEIAGVRFRVLDWDDGLGRFLVKQE